jgi:L-fuculose-phosphate aldolase
VSFSIRRDILAAGRRLVAAGLTQGTSGNVSARSADGFVITPSALPYDQMEPADLVPMMMDGTVPRGSRPPSTEWRIHRDIYAARSEFGAVVHAHPPFATTIACLRRDLPAVHYMIAVAGGSDVRCAPYATFGTGELSANVLAALAGRSACLLANHGLVACGADLTAAMRVAEEIELVAQIYWRSLAVGTPFLLDDAEMSRVIEKFGDYGTRR